MVSRGGNGGRGEQYLGIPWTGQVGQVMKSLTLNIVCGIDLGLFLSSFQRTAPFKMFRSGFDTSRDGSDHGNQQCAVNQPIAC